MKRFTCTPRWDSAWLLILSLAGLARAQPLTVIWDKRGFGEHSHFGSQVYALGDQNNDGYADFAVLSSGTGTPSQESEARFDLFYGGNPPDAAPYMTFRSDIATEQEFWRFQSVGDLNGDGFVEWQVWMYSEGNPLPFTINTLWGGPFADSIPDFVFSHASSIMGLFCRRLQR